MSGEKPREEQVERIMRGIGKLFLEHEAASAMYVEPLAQLLMDDPARAVDLIAKTYKKGLDVAYADENLGNVRAFVCAIAGGPCEIVPQAVYNAVGAVYPYLEGSLKDRALGRVLNILDEINYIYVQEFHTLGIREPLLLSDIAIARPFYWPESDEGKKLIKENPLFSEWRGNPVDERGMFYKGKVQSDFCVAYSLLRSDFCDFGERYAEIANPEFLNRTLQGIVAMRFAGVEDEDKMVAGRERLKQLLPESAHDKIEDFRIRGGWADNKLFR